MDPLARALARLRTQRTEEQERHARAMLALDLRIHALEQADRKDVRLAVEVLADMGLIDDWEPSADTLRRLNLHLVEGRARG